MHYGYGHDTYHTLQFYTFPFTLLRPAIRLLICSSPPGYLIAVRYLLLLLLHFGWDTFTLLFPFTDVTDIYLPGYLFVIAMPLQLGPLPTRTTIRYIHYITDIAGCYLVVTVPRCRPVQLPWDRFTVFPDCTFPLPQFIYYTFTHYHICDHCYSGLLHICTHVAWDTRLHLGHSSIYTIYLLHLYHSTTFLRPITDSSIPLLDLFIYL